MGWPYEYVADLPSDVYDELLAMLADEARERATGDDATPDDAIGGELGR